MGDSIDAEEELRLGMVNKVVPVDELRAATLKFAKRMTLVSPEALYAAKLSINRGAEAAGFRNAINADLLFCSNAMMPRPATHGAGDVPALPTRANKPDSYVLGSYRIATAPEPNSSRLTSFRSTCFDSPANSVGPWPASRGCTTNSYSSINPSSASASGSFTYAAC